MAMNATCFQARIHSLCTKAALPPVSEQSEIGPPPLGVAPRRRAARPHQASGFSGLTGLHDRFFLLIRVKGGKAAAPSAACP